MTKKEESTPFSDMYLALRARSLKQRLKDVEIIQADFANLPIYTEQEMQKKCEEYLDGFAKKWWDEEEMKLFGEEAVQEYKAQKREEVQGAV